jgi:hypothetical protein
MSEVFSDKNGVPIQKHDLLKVYHFTGARRKKHYMYKYVIQDEADFSKDYFTISSLSECGHCYHVPKHSGISPDIEIIQGTNFVERTKR